MSDPLTFASTLPFFIAWWQTEPLRTYVRPRGKRFSKSLKLYRTDAWALNNRGLAYLKLDRSDEARDDFEAALRIDPRFDAARQNLDSISGTGQAR